MLDKLLQYITSKYLKFDNGQLFFGKDRVVLYFVPQLAHEFLSYKNLFGTDYCVNSFLLGRETGVHFVETHAVPMKKMLTPVVALSCDILGTFGFGKFRTLKVEEKDRFMVVVGNSTIGTEIKKSFGGSLEPVDFSLGGVFAGALQYFSKMLVYAVEIRCCAQKDVSECVWVCGSEEKIESYVKEFSPELLTTTTSMLEKIKKGEAVYGKNNPSK